MTLDEYIKSVGARYKSGISTEHSYRGDLQSLLQSILEGVLVTNEPSRIACGAPDYILTKKNIPLGYIEAKDLGANLDNKQYKEQFDRYKASLGNIIFTNYLDFHFYRDGELLFKIELAQIDGNKLSSSTQNFDSFTDHIKSFATQTGQTIKSPKKLAEMMAAKAKLLAEVIEKSLTKPFDPDHPEAQEPGDNTLQEQLRAFQQILIHDIDAKEFADIYAQTLVYGMFAARLHDPNLGTFSRQEAAELIPKSNPFLRKLFQYIAGYDLDDRIKWIVDDLADIFRATDVSALLKNFGQATQQTDPIIHFYETFLSEYDPKLRKSRGVWYTPEPVVNFIVRAVDDILKSEFDLKEGLADTSKTKIKVVVNGKKVEKEVHKVQILDPATGTGTFLAEVIKQIHSKFEGQKGIWNNYVEDHLIPRLNGFEILMASYAMAHLKLDLLLTETGFKPKKDQRLRVYLTNSLEEHHPETGTLFASWLSNEANEANHVKRDTPVMCVIGNPPYAVSSTNKSEWIGKLIADYKKDLNERNIQPLSDDYIKFIRFGQHFIDKNGDGILAYISNNSFIDGIIHRQMRKDLLESFDKIYILDLHGSSKKNETTNDGGKDENVFDIQQGVSINIFIKNGKRKKSELGQVFHFDFYGTREHKYESLSQKAIHTINWNELDYSSPNYFFTKKNFTETAIYEVGFKVDVLFKHSACGIVTARDGLVVQQHKKDLDIIINDFKLLDEGTFRIKYNERTDSRDWIYLNAKKDLENASIKRIDYRPFDKRFIIYSSKSKGILSYPRNEIMKHMISGDNLGLLICKQQSTFDFQHIFITNSLSDKCSVSLQTKEATYHFPLYLYPETKVQQTIEQTSERTPNLNTEIIKEIAEKLGLTFTNEKETTKNTFTPIDILDYIYAVLHSPSYRDKYKEFLKIDFPRVPYQTDKDTFWRLVKLGGELRQIHLLESPVVDKFITKYPEDGDNKVGKLKYLDGKVWINDTQYFSGVPLVAWEFYIGGYQPAQKWLKDRKDRVLSFEDIRHYQRIIVALTETERIMKEIDKIEFV